MKRGTLALATIAVAMAGTAYARAPRAMPGGAYANPSAIVAAEIAFNRRAQEKGQWAAFREYAAEDAVMFAPEPVNARTWLKGRADPASPIKWQPGEIWMSCDGTLALSKGAWQQPDGSVGYFTTIWRRNKKDEYEWILDQGDKLASPAQVPEMIAGTVADCGLPRQVPSGGAVLGASPKQRFQPAAPGAMVPGMTGGGASLDGTMTFSYSVDADFGRTVTVSLLRNGTMQQVVESRVAPAPAK